MCYTLTNLCAVAVFFAMAIGLACGLGQVLFAGLFTVLVSLAMLVLQKGIRLSRYVTVRA